MRKGNKGESAYRAKQGRAVGDKAHGRRRIAPTSPFYAGGYVNADHRLACAVRFAAMVDDGTISKDDPRHPDFIFSPYERQRRR